MWRYLKGMEWIVSSIGVSGILIAFGFLIDLAFQERLGYQVSYFSSIIVYVTLAGAFLVDSSFLILHWVSEYPLLTFVSLLLLIILTFIARRYGINSHAFTPKATTVSLLLLTLFSFTILVR